MSNLSVSKREKDDKEWLPQEVTKTGLSKEPLDQDNEMIVHWSKQTDPLYGEWLVVWNSPHHLVVAWPFTSGRSHKRFHHCTRIFVTWHHDDCIFSSLSLLIGLVFLCVSRLKVPSVINIHWKIEYICTGNFLLHTR